MLYFLAGLFIGAFLGVLIIALCTAAHNGDKNIKEDHNV